jgi:hypothetical protein
MFLVLGAHHRTSWAQSNRPLRIDATRISWTQLSFFAKNYWVEVSTDIQLRSMAASELDALLLKSPKGNPIQSVTPEAAQMTIDTTIDPRFRSPVNIHNRIWFDPTNASALGRVRLRRGEDDFKKMYRFTQKGVFRHRIEPTNAEEAMLEPEKWTDIKDTFFPHDTDRLECPVVSERSLLIIALSAYAMSRDNKPLTICVFGKRQLHRVQIHKEGTQSIKVDYIEKKQESEIRKDSSVRALKMVITAQPIPPHLEDPENFSFLGLHRDICVYIEPASGLPITVSGIIPTVGKVDLELQEVRLKPSSNKTSNNTFPGAVALH